MNLKKYKERSEREWQKQYEEDEKKFSKRVAHYTTAYEQACRDRDCLLKGNITEETVSNKNYSLVDNPELFKATYSVQDLKRRLFIAKAKQKYARPNKFEDVSYRQHQELEFQQKILDIIPSDLLMRFHASPIYFSEHIIKSKKIVPSQDTFGIKTSADMSGKISVTRADNLHIHTLPFYSGLWEYKESLPAGCIFAIFPIHESELEDDKWLMDKIDFSTHPEQLYKIITTPENVTLVKKWCKESGLDISCVCDYEKFLKSLSKDIKNGRFENRTGIQYKSSIKGSIITQVVDDSFYKSAIEATEEGTRTGTINTQAQTIKSVERAKKQEQEIQKDVGEQ